MIVPLDLPDDLLDRVQGAARDQGMTFREFVADALRSAATAPRVGSSRVFVQKAHDFGAHLESPWTALAEIETEDYTSQFRK